MEIPQTVTCPDCNGNGWYYEGDDESQCEKCGGEGKINIKEYAKNSYLTEEEAYIQLKSEGSDEEE